jgi:cation diffusion facilitator CzcD-associated flavoprotein CzcO
VVVNAGGQFYKPKGWDIPGMETFEGTQWHTAEWRHDFDLTGKRVAIIGTGPSTGQVAPSIQPLVKQLYVYQRSATYVVPRGDGPIPAWKKRLLSWFPPLLWMYHLWWYWSVRFTSRRRKLQKLTKLKFETSKPMWLLGTQQNNGAAAYSAAFLEKQVESPEIREKLTPKDPFGCKRILVLDDYLTIFNKKNVELITEKPVRITKTGIVSDDGKEREVDVILNGTGKSSESRYLIRANIPRFRYFKARGPFSSVWCRWTQPGRTMGRNSFCILQ